MHNRTAIQHKNLVCKREHLIEVFANEQDCLAVATCFIEQLMHCFYCPNVESSRWRTHNEHSGVCSCSKDFPGKQHLLRIATGKFARSGKRAWGLDFQLLNKRFSFDMCRLSINKKPAIACENKIVDNRKRRRKPSAQPIFWHIGKSSFSHIASTHTVYTLAIY